MQQTESNRSHINTEINEIEELVSDGDMNANVNAGAAQTSPREQSPSTMSKAIKNADKQASTTSR